MLSILSFPDFSVLDRKKTYPLSRKREEEEKEEVKTCLGKFSISTLNNGPVEPSMRGKWSKIGVQQDN